MCSIITKTLGCQVFHPDLWEHGMIAGVNFWEKYLLASKIISYGNWTFSNGFSRIHPEISDSKFESLLFIEKSWKELVKNGAEQVKEIRGTQEAIWEIRVS